MTEAMDRLVTLLESIDDAYDDFILGTALMASDFGIVETVADYIEGNDGVTTSEVLDWIVEREKLETVITIDGSGRRADEA